MGCLLQLAGSPVVVRSPQTRSKKIAICIAKKVRHGRVKKRNLRLPLHQKGFSHAPTRISCFESAMSVFFCNNGMCEILCQARVLLVILVAFLLSCRVYKRVSCKCRRSGHFIESQSATMEILPAQPMLSKFKSAST